MSSYTIRELTIDEIPKLKALGEQFTHESKYVKFDMEFFKTSWESFLTAGIGAIFVAETAMCEIAGTIGGLKFNEPNSGVLMANELFWIVSPDHRGGCGILLLNRLETWAKETGCKWLWMNYLIDSMPDKVQSIYERKGFTIAETHWVKEIST